MRQIIFIAIVIFFTLFLLLELPKMLPDEFGDKILEEHEKAQATTERARDVRR